MLVKKRTISDLSKEEMQNVVGGERLTVINSCGANCDSIIVTCNISLVTQMYCTSFPESPDNDTCAGQPMCGSEHGATCIEQGCP